MSPTTSPQGSEGVTISSRVWATPMRDLLRGRVTGRLNYRRLVALAGLPPQAGELIIGVVKRTRLWRLEKASVAEELIAHFADGLEADVAVDELVRSFGDPGSAAQLIRRAKRRQRPLPWHVFRYTSLTVAAAVMFYICSIVYFLAGSPTPSTDYLSQFNAAAVAVEEDDRAWPIYRQALLGVTDFHETMREYKDTPRPGEEGWDVALAYIEDHAESVSLIRKAAARSGLGYVAGYPRQMEEADRKLWGFDDPDDTEPTEVETIIGVLLPQLSELRKCAKILMLDSRRAALIGDGETILANTRAMIGMAGHAKESPTFINDLVAMSILWLAVDGAGELLAENPQVLSEGQLRDLAHRLAVCDDIVSVRFFGERMMFEDVVQHIYTDDGKGDGRLTIEGLRLMSGIGGGLGSNGLATVDGGFVTALITPAVGTIMPSRRETLAYHDRLMTMFEAEARLPLWEAEESRADKEIEQASDHPLSVMRQGLPRLLMPAVGKVHQQAEKTIARRDGLLVAVALKIHHLRYHEWPATLDELVPSILPAVPPDRFDGEPLRYALVDGEPVVYSIGTDRDDDGGLPPTWMNTDGPNYDAAAQWLSLAAVEEQKQGGGEKAEFRRIPDADWILWPRQYLSSAESRQPG